jgi:predicted lipoprotein with Yx(FWY)xxD motif
MRTFASSALAVLALSACSTTSSSSAAGYHVPSSSTSTPPSSSPASNADAATASTKLGTIIVDGKGMTAYVYLKDTANSGVSTCTGSCSSAWPAITSKSATPSVTAITGTVGITKTGQQITINGLPIYTFASDSAPGDTNGQGVGNVWFVLSAGGQKITTK